MGFVLNPARFAASGPAPTAQWRIVVTAAQGGGTFLGMSQMILRDTAWTGANLATDANCAVTYGSGTDNGTKANLFDGNPATEYFSPAGFTTATFEFTFGSPALLEQVVFVGRTTADYNQDTQDFTIEYNDGSTWVEWVSITGDANYLVGEGRAFNADGVMTDPGIGYKSGIIVFTQYNDTFCGFSEVRFRDSGGTNHNESAPTAVPTSGWGALSSINDGDTATDAFTSTLPGYLKFDWGTAEAIVDAQLRVRNGFPTQSPNDFKIFLSPDALVWFEKSDQVDETGWTGGETRTYSL